MGWASDQTGLVSWCRTRLKTHEEGACSLCLQFGVAWEAWRGKPLNRWDGRDEDAQASMALSNVETMVRRKGWRWVPTRKFRYFRCLFHGGGVFVNSCEVGDVPPT